MRKQKDDINKKQKKNASFIPIITNAYHTPYTRTHTHTLHTHTHTYTHTQREIQPPRLSQQQSMAPGMQTTEEVTQTLLGFFARIKNSRKLAKAYERAVVAMESVKTEYSLIDPQEHESVPPLHKYHSAVLLGVHLVAETIRAEGEAIALPLYKCTQTPCHTQKNEEAKDTWKKRYEGNVDQVKFSNIHNVKVLSDTKNALLNGVFHVYWRELTGMEYAVPVLTYPSHHIRTNVCSTPPLPEYTKKTSFAFELFDFLQNATKISEGLPYVVFNNATAKQIVCLPCTAKNEQVELEKSVKMWGLGPTDSPTEHMLKDIIAPWDHEAVKTFGQCKGSRQFLDFFRFYRNPFHSETIDITEPKTKKNKTNMGTKV